MARTDTPVSPASSVPAAEFSVREFARSAHGSHRARLNLDAYAAAPLDQDTLGLVDLIARLERSALRYLRSVLVTPTHADARMTAFLVTWAYEKYWLADALEAIVAAHPTYTPTPAATSLPARVRLAWHGLAERFEPVRESVVANLIGEDVIAVHSIAGALDEWVLQAAYQRLVDAGPGTQLAATLAELLAVKRRHGDFFAAQARDRLAGSVGAARLARRRLRRAPLPLGSLDEPPVLLSRLLGGLVQQGELAAIDRRLDAYPGLTGLHLAVRAAARAAHRTPGSSAPKENPQL